MPVADRLGNARQVHAQLWRGLRPAASAVRSDAVLKPLSRPEFGEIPIQEDGLDVGRAAYPFATFGKVAKTLSRAHARIFRKDGVLYVADANSRNGTTVNRVRLRSAHAPLADGDEICFGGVLSYRLQIAAPAQPANLRVTLTPIAAESGLEPIAIARFPFSIGKTDGMFYKYVNETAHGPHLEYLSRRHAYIYLKDGRPFVEDLGSSNGTFVDGERLNSAVALTDQAVVAFGGKHFVYRVDIAQTMLVEVASGKAHVAQAEVEVEVVMPPAEEGTQFIAAPSSFLRLLCEGDRPKELPAPGSLGVAAPVVKRPVAPRRRGARLANFFFELAALNATDEGERASRHWWWWAGAAAGVLVMLALTNYFLGAPERNLNAALASGEYARAETLAHRLLERHPEDLELKARATEAALNANVPVWLDKVRAHDFEAAKSVLRHMSELGYRDADLPPLIGELEWLVGLESLVAGRGGPDAPMRIYADEDGVEQLIEHWNNDTGEHQRDLNRIASRVPQFGDWYGSALTHLRRLQSEATVYLPIIEHTKARIAAELQRDDPEALDEILKETGEKYPGLGGMDSLRGDLARFLEIRREVRQRESRRLFAVLCAAHFTTPAFESALSALEDSGLLPSAELLLKYSAATQAWKDGGGSAALDSLLQMEHGYWAQDIAAEFERRRGVMLRFAAVEQSRTSAGFLEQLLSVRESLDTQEDAYYTHAIAAELNVHRDQVAAKAEEAMNRARASWQEYKSNGAIDASQRIETSISDGFRKRARSLADASRYARQGFFLYAQVGSPGAIRWAAIRDAIETEASQQRSRLLDLSNVVEPELLKSKLALLGDTKV